MNNDLRLWKLSYQNNVSRLRARSEKASDTIYVERVKTDPSVSSPNDLNIPPSPLTVTGGSSVRVRR